MSSYKGGLTTKHVEKTASTQPDIIFPLVSFIGVTGFLILRDPHPFPTLDSTGIAIEVQFLQTN